MADKNRAGRTTKAAAVNLEVYDSVKSVGGATFFPKREMSRYYSTLQEGQGMGIWSSLHFGKSAWSANIIYFEIRIEVVIFINELLATCLSVWVERKAGEDSNGKLTVWTGHGTNK